MSDGFRLWELCWLCKEADERLRLLRIITVTAVFTKLQMYDFDL